MSNVEENGPKFRPGFVGGVDIPRVVRQSGKQVGETANEMQTSVSARISVMSSYIMFAEDAERRAQFAATCEGINDHNSDLPWNPYHSSS